MPYKVVEKQTRHCSNWTLYKTYPQIAKVCKYRRDHPEWFPKYFKGRVIKEAPGSIGILCFKSKADAFRFIESYNYKHITWLIVQVKGINKRNDVQSLICGCAARPTNLCLTQDRCASPPRGTVAYREVLVLE